MFSALCALNLCSLPSVSISQLVRPYSRGFVVAVGALALAACGELSTVSQGGQQGQTTVAAPVEAPAPAENQGSINIGTAEAPTLIAADAPASEILAAREVADVPAFAIDMLYRNLGVEAIWGQGGAWLPGAAQVVQILNSSYAHGLQPNAYLPASIDGTVHTVTADRALSAGLIKYISDMRFGRTRGNYAAATDLAIKSVRSGQDLTTAIAALEPQDYFYQRIKSAALPGLASRGASAPNFVSLETTMEKLRTSGGPRVAVGRKVLVNIAGFDLQAWDNGRLELASNVIVGKEGRLSPVGPDSISNLKFSPDWNAPRSIIEKDLYPKLVQNPEQFKRFGLRVFINNRMIIDPSTIDWAGISPQQIHVKQIPGPWNVLGGVRFTLSNSQSVYLHDTSNGDPYRQFERAESSGCIRVEKAAELAAWILAKDAQPLPEVDLKERMERGDISYVYLRQKMPVEMVYYTAWVDGSGTLKLVRDIYNRDSDLRQRMQVGI